MSYGLFKYKDGEGRVLHVEIAQGAMFDEYIKVLSEEVKEQIIDKFFDVDFFEYATEEESLSKKKAILEEEQDS